MNDINQYIDQTILRADVTRQDIFQFLAGVKKYRFFSACVSPCWVELVRQELPDDIRICSVVGFPLGSSTTKAKVYATEDLIKIGCDEIDMVMNVGRLKSKDYEYVAQEIKAVVDAAQKRVVKVIIETCLLTTEEKIASANIIMESGAHFVKTSTGFSQEGARLDDVKLLRKIVGPKFGVKASGGIRDYKTALAFIEAGANRIGTSAGEKIMQELMVKPDDKHRVYPGQ